MQEQPKEACYTGRIIDCTGTGRARGLAHGEGARELVRAAVACWAEVILEDQPEGATIEHYAISFLAKTGLMSMAEQLFPDLMAEIGGIADGAGLPYETLAAYNLMDEQWWYDLPVQRAVPGCSVLALPSGDGMLLAQNMDLPGFMDGSQVVLRIREPGGAPSLVLSSAGLIGLTGVSHAGFAICVNTLLMLNHDAAGVPVVFALRSALRQGSAGAAAVHLQCLRHASGQHYAIADRDGVTSLECSATSVVTVVQCAAGPMLHTNHPLQCTDIDHSALEIMERNGDLANSRERYLALDAAIGCIDGAEGIAALLSDTGSPLCFTSGRPGASHTFGSVLFTLGSKLAARFRLGHPAAAPWQEVAFTG